MWYKVLEGPSWLTLQVCPSRHSGDQSQLVYRIQGPVTQTRPKLVNPRYTRYVAMLQQTRKDVWTKIAEKCVKNIHLLVLKPLRISEIIKLNYACYIHRNNLSLSFIKVNVFKWIIHTRIWLAIQLKFFQTSIFLPVGYWIKSLINYLFIFPYVIINPFINIFLTF